MAEIKIQLIELTNAINTLQNLRVNTGKKSIKMPATVGGGKVVNELEVVAEAYQQIEKNIDTMISNTIKFLTNVRDSYIASDQKAQQGISK